MKSAPPLMLHLKPLLLHLCATFAPPSQHNLLQLLHLLHLLYRWRGGGALVLEHFWGCGIRQGTTEDRQDLPHRNGCTTEAIMNTTNITIEQVAQWCEQAYRRGYQHAATQSQDAPFTEQEMQQIAKWRGKPTTVALPPPRTHYRCTAYERLAMEVPSIHTGAEQ